MEVKSIGIILNENCTVQLKDKVVRLAARQNCWDGNRAEGTGEGE